MNGLISLWDFEIGKFNSGLLGHKSEITDLKFLEDYPILVSSSSDGTLRIWGTKVPPGKKFANFKMNCIACIYHTIPTK